MKFNVNKMVKMAVLAGLGIILMLYVRFPFPLAPFLEYEPGDVPALIGTFIFGPAAGFIITVIISLIQAITVSAGSGWIGAFMHLVATGMMVVVAGFIYKKIHTLKGAIIALIAGTLSMTAIMVPFNLIFTPLFMAVPVDQVMKMLLPVIIPFNLFKATVNSVLVAMVYKSAARVLRAESVRNIKRDPAGIK